MPQCYWLVSTFSPLIIVSTDTFLLVPEMARTEVQILLYYTEVDFVALYTFQSIYFEKICFHSITLWKLPTWALDWLHRSHATPMLSPAEVRINFILKQQSSNNRFWTNSLFLSQWAIWLLLKNFCCHAYLTGGSRRPSCCRQTTGSTWRGTGLFLSVYW